MLRLQPLLSRPCLGGAELATIGVTDLRTGLALRRPSAGGSRLRTVYKVTGCAHRVASSSSCISWLLIARQVLDHVVAPMAVAESRQLAEQPVAVPLVERAGLEVVGVEPGRMAAPAQRLRLGSRQEPRT